jgi:hypothetical protein
MDVQPAGLFNPQNRGGGSSSHRKEAGMKNANRMSRQELNRAAVELGVTRDPDRYVESHLRIRVEKAQERRSRGQARRDLAA